MSYRLSCVPIYNTTNLLLVSYLKKAPKGLKYNNVLRKKIINQTKFFLKVGLKLFQWNAVWKMLLWFCVKWVICNEIHWQVNQKCYLVKELSHVFFYNRLKQKYLKVRSIPWIRCFVRQSHWTAGIIVRVALPVWQHTSVTCVLTHIMKK